MNVDRIMGIVQLMRPGDKILLKEGGHKIKIRKNSEQLELLFKNLNYQYVTSNTLEGLHLLKKRLEEIR